MTPEVQNRRILDVLRYRGFFNNFKAIASGCGVQMHFMNDVRLPKLTHFARKKTVVRVIKHGCEVCV